ATNGTGCNKPAASPEDGLLDLLGQAEGYTYALAHSYDIGGQPDRAYAFVALGERLRETASDVSDLARTVEPHTVARVLGLRSRAFSLRTLLRGTAVPRPSVVPTTVPLTALTGGAVNIMTTITSSNSEKPTDSFLAPAC